MNKIFENKKAYDPGRLRHKISFVEQSIIDDGYGGTTVVETEILNTWAGKDEVSEYVQSQLNSGQSIYSQFQYFVIRNRKNFTPLKDMRIVFDGNKYTVRSVKQLDDPCTFLKILCVVEE